MTVENISSKLTGAQPSREQLVRFDILRNQTRRTVPAGDDFRDQGQRLAAATAGTAVDSTALTPGKRYKFRLIDAGGGTSYIRTKVSGAVTAATNASWPLVTTDEGYLYCPLDGSWTAISFLAPNLTAFLHIMESRTLEEDRL